MVGVPLPAFNLQGLYDESQFYSRDDLLDGDFMLINVWASWCAACKSEHGFLTRLQHQGIDIIGLNYRDERKPALSMLKDLGDPYQAIIYDIHGSLALDLGVIGAPETFLISPAGEIVHRFSGVLDKQIWDKQFVPLLVGVGK
jgi:cytochrome c biogenesis protein CcmG/thiol:disulfide interchange protein DsbE